MNSIPDTSGDAEEDSMAGMNALTRRHESLLAENAVKIGILRAYLVDKLGGIGCGNFWIGGVFPDEVMCDDL